MILQFEVSGLCNMSCDFCLRNHAKICRRNLSFDEFKEIVEQAQSFDRVEKILLYGFGEPGMNPELDRIVRYASSLSEVVLLTNGLALKSVESMLERITLGLSVHGSVERAVSTLTSVLPASRRENIELELVLDRQNLEELAKCVELGFNVFSSNLLAYDRKHYSRVLYCEVSRKCVEIVENSGIGWRELEDVVRGLRRFEPKSLEVYAELSEKAEKLGYQLNLSWIVENRERIDAARRAEAFAERVAEMGEERGVRVSIPNFFADSVSRECPYRNTVFVRADAKLASCMEFSYTHREFVNGHEKSVESVIYSSFEEALDDFSRLKDACRYPWCGDCQLKQFCWFAEKTMDCYGYEPSCSECLYSAGIVVCRQ